MGPTIGLFILTKNEEDWLEGCLKTCAWADEVIIVDSGSTDNTLSIAKAHGVRVIQHPFTNFLEQRQVAISHLSTEWVGYIDADERFSETLISEIKTFIRQSESTLLEIPRRNYVHDKWIAHCNWYPDYQRRVVKKEALTFEDKIVHEQLSTTGRISRLPEKTEAYITHYTCPNLTDYIAKLNHYSSLEADYYAGKPEHPFTLTPWGIFSRSLGMFTQTFFHFKGYKDGIPGFIVAGFQFLASFMLMIKLWERESGHMDKERA